MNDALPEVVSEQEWQKAFDAMLVKEKELTRARDEVAVNARDTTFVLASPADQDKIAALKRRMDWHAPWYTMVGDDFGADFGVSEWFGINVFLRDDEDRVYRTYFVNARGAEPFTPTWAILDVTPFGRQEEWEDSPAGRPQTPPYEWWRLHGEYA